jgi:uncharacterized protein with von Willebrand factor type A (vWA) domain
MGRGDDLSKWTIDNDLYDRNHFEDVKEEAPKISEAEKELRKKTQLPEFLSQDVYSALYKAEPEKVDERTVHPEVEHHRQITDMMFDNEEYEKLRNFTFLDEFAAAIAVVPLMRELAKHMPDLDKKGRGQAQAQGQGQGEGEGQGDGQGQGDGKGKNKKQPPKGQPPKLTEEQMEAIKQAAEQACKQAVKDIDDSYTSMLGWGSEPGEIQKLSFKEKFALRDRFMNNQKLRKLARMVGKAANLALSAQKTKVKHGADEVYDVELGKNLGRILPSEKMLLMSGEAGRLEFMHKFAEGKLMQYKLRAVLKEQKGPIVCCIDNSGSMSGDPELWSKALALGLLEIAVKQKRKLVILHFGSSYDGIKRFDFSANDAPLNRKIDMAEFFLGGGTDFQAPLNMAKKIVNEELPKADIVMVTDGWCNVSDSWNKEWDEWRDKKGVSVYSVFINPGGGEVPDVLNKISTQVVHATDLYRHGDTYQKEVFEMI